MRNVHGGSRREAESAGGGGTAGYRGGGSAEQLHFRILERKQTGGIAVGGRLKLPRAVNLEADHAAVVGYDISILVSYLYGEVDKLGRRRLR